MISNLKVDLENSIGIAGRVVLSLLEVKHIAVLKLKKQGIGTCVYLVL